MKKPGGGEQIVVVTCGEHYNRECFLCTEWNKLMNSYPSDMPWEEKRNLRSTERQRPENKLYFSKQKFISPLIFDGEMKVYSYGPQVKQQLDECCNNKFGGYFEHPVTGFPIYIT